jgi:hypothetical protein
MFGEGLRRMSLFIVIVSEIKILDYSGQWCVSELLKNITMIIISIKLKYRY